MKKKAFTLVEILIIVAIAGILAAIIIPKFTEMKRNEGSAVETTQVDELTTEETQYSMPQPN